MSMQIVAIGGVSFAPDAPNLIDRHIISLTGKPNPKVCFIPTASADAEGYINNFYRAYTQMGCIPDDLPLFRRRVADLAGFLGEQDIIYVGGGNTRSMLAVWREWELDRILREVGEAGTVLCGISAGGICWFEQGMTDSIPGAFTSMTALGYLPGSFNPHHDEHPDRRPDYLRMVASGELSTGWAAEGSAALHFRDGALIEAICAEEGKRCYCVQPDGQGGAQEKPLPTRYLGE